MYRKGGFTLMELMIVIAIIGVLAGALFPTITGYFDRARVAAIHSFVRDMRNKGETLVYYNFESIGTGGYIPNGGNNSDGNYDLLKMSGGSCVGSVAYGTGIAGLKKSGFFASGSCNYSIDPIKLSGSNFIIMHWIKTNSMLSQTYTVLNTGNQDGFRFGVNGGQIGVLEGNIFSYDEGSCGSAPNISDGKWHHIAAEFLASQGKILCYYDGKNVGSRTIQPAYGGFTDQTLYVGNYPWWPSKFEGELDEVYIVREDFR